MFSISHIDINAAELVRGSLTTHDAADNSQTLLRPHPPTSWPDTGEVGGIRRSPTPAPGVRTLLQISENISPREALVI
jgi:hypothetical protein